MAKFMKIGGCLFCILTVILLLLYQQSPHSALLTAVITCGTFAYHLCMRLLAGFCFDHCMNNQTDYNRPWYQLRPFEEKLYGKFQVRKWKKHLPTYDPTLFDLEQHSLEEIAQSM